MTEPATAASDLTLDRFASPLGEILVVTDADGRPVQASGQMM